MKKMIRRDRKLGIKALSLAAIAGLTLFGLQAQAEEAPEISVDNMSSSNNIVWHEISKETADNSDNVISITVPQNGETIEKYYQYSYNNEKIYEN